LRESGIDGIEAGAWNGLVAPAKTPVAILNKIRAAVVEIMAEPVVREKLTALYMDPVASTPDEFRDVLQQELDRWGPVIEKNNIRIE
jgi:tripartite-type tricarboxylate transporter receptor subunit TctC